MSYKKGDIVMIKNQSPSGAIIDEGKAKLVKLVTNEWKYPQWDVEFLSEKGTNYRRYIY